jgi:hypothetical protein
LKGKKGKFKKNSMDLFFIDSIDLRFYWEGDKNIHSMILSALGYIDKETFDAMNKAYSPQENIPIEVYTYYLYLKGQYVTEYTATQELIETLITQAMASGTVNGFFIIGYYYAGQRGTIVFYIHPKGVYTIEKQTFPNGAVQLIPIVYTNPKSSYYIQTHGPKISQPKFLWYGKDKPE